MVQTTLDDSGIEVNETEELVHLSENELPTLLLISAKLRAFVDAIGRFGSWFAMPLVLITAFDLGIRSTGRLQVWMVENISEYFGSTLLQELEWHFHTVLFVLVLGFGYIWNTHVRVDLVRETLAFRKKAWIEFIGLSIFVIPFTILIIYFATVYAYDSWAINRRPDCAWYQCGEISASLVGMSHRWVIKAIMAFGFLMAMVAGIAVWLEMFCVLFGQKNLRFKLSTLEWPEADIDTVEGKERLNLAKAEDHLESRSKQWLGQQAD